MKKSKTDQFNQTDSYRKLAQYKKEIQTISIKQLFNREDQHNKNRFQNFSCDREGIFLDYSKNKIDQKIMNELLNLLEEVDLRSGIEAMFQGEKINWTEDRRVLHTSLRDFSQRHLLSVEQEERTTIFNSIQKVQDKMKTFSTQVREGRWRGQTGKPITDVVNIGIGGSFLGPQTVVEALKDYADGPKVHFISNLDGSDLQHTLKKLNPEQTLFLIASKTFTTEETITNALLAKQWISDHLGVSKQAIRQHFVALSSNQEAVVQFGIGREQMFEFWDFVGGRFSTWSAIGLSITLSLGYERFEAFLKGAEAMDLHFKNTSFENNLPVLLGVLLFWYVTFWNCQNYAVLPYSHLLTHFPAYLQQLDMESNGKYISRSGQPVTYKTAPITWGAEGTNAQHSFYQLLHQGTITSMIDFIGVLNPNHPHQNSHDRLMAHLIAQSESLAWGLESEEAEERIKQETKITTQGINDLTPHRTFIGNRPSNTLLLEKITPESIGKLMALYEHRTMVTGYLWSINSFDQWGVELGKNNAKKILNLIEKDKKSSPQTASNFDSSANSSTTGLIRRYL